MTLPAPSELPNQPGTIARGGGRRWIHPFPTKGRYTRLRLLSTSVLLALFYVTPWLMLGDRPFLRLSFLNTSFVMFGHPILIDEFYHFVLLALLLVVTLFFASNLYGRIWCGYACPQTVFIEQILGRIETLFEGPPAKRLAAQGKPLTWQRALRKTGKQLAFLAVSFSFAFTLVAFFTGPYALLDDLHAGPGVALVLLTALAWFDGAYWREQFCHIVCPYGRFQGVMQDRATRTIGYDPHRGEPRRRGKDRTGAGDCIDCGLCVRVCPSGIDIRQGAHQLECIGCAKCIDACDGVMATVGKPRGLIRYDAVAMFGAELPSRRPSWLRPRVGLYAAIWLTLFSVGLYGFLTRASFKAKLLNTRGAAPYVVDNGQVKNLFNIKVGNQADVARSFELSLVDAEGLTIASPTRLGPVESGRELSYPVLVASPPAATGTRIRLMVRDTTTGESQVVDREFVRPPRDDGARNDHG